MPDVQLAFWKRQGAPHNGTPTSIEAARHIARSPNRSEQARRDILEFIRSRGEFGATDKEIQNKFHFDGSFERPRRVELVEEGLIQERYGKDCRPLTREETNEYGRMQHFKVWVITPGKE